MVDDSVRSRRLMTLEQAFKTTLPVLCGYLAIGIAFGLLLKNAGYPWLLALLMSLVIYAGAGQYLAVNFFINNTGLIEIATVIFLVNFRHMLYGLSLFDKFDLTGKFKPYMIFALTDETYALLTSVKDPNGVEKRYFYFFIALLNQSYWILGSVIGAVAGGYLHFNTRGLDFALTALFIVLLLEQLRSYKTRIPFLIGGGCAIMAIIAVGRSNMLLAAVVTSIVLLLLFKRRIIADET
jgi:4-azaleucine resistance transporter AzlC